jgi:chromosomal replication initiation ATPase DnaA
MVELEICIQALQEQLRGIEKSSSAFVASLRQQLDELSAELIKRKQDDMELRLRNEELARKKQALSKKVARFDGRFETGVAKLSTQSLKEDGMISTEIRACVRDIVSFGAPVESVDKIIHAVAKGLNIQICDHISARSTGRIVIEGGVAAQLQIVDAIKDADRSYTQILFSVIVHGTV